MSYLEDHKEEIFKKYTKEDLLADINNYKLKSGRLSKLLNHYFEECIFNCKSNRYSKTPMEALQNDDDMSWILNYIQSKPNFYTGNEVSNVKSFFRNGTRIARKVANFCPKNARNAYFRYFDIGANITCLDTSAGFGARMCSVLLNGASYIGFDPNTQVVTKLNEMYSFFKDNNLVTDNQNFKIYNCGSEEFQPELVDSADVMFTSPPYFNLETYSDDIYESNKNYKDYHMWIDRFVKPTVDNVYKYLKYGGYVMVNIKNLTNMGKQCLFDDWFNIIDSHPGFEFVEVFEMNHQGAKNFWMNTNYSKEDYNGYKEPVMVFKKV